MPALLLVPKFLRNPPIFKFQFFLLCTTWSFSSRHATWPFESDVSRLMHPSEVSLAATSFKKKRVAFSWTAEAFPMKRTDQSFKMPVNWTLLSCSSSGWEVSQLGAGEGAWAGQRGAGASSAGRSVGWHWNTFKKLPSTKRMSTSDFLFDLLFKPGSHYITPIRRDDKPNVAFVSIEP